MNIAHATLSAGTPMSWSADWAWSLPLIVATLILHVVGLGLFDEKVISWLGSAIARRHSRTAFVTLMSATVLMATVLHGLEAAVWAAAYRFLDALPDARTAMLYSLSSMTSYGHANLFLSQPWQLMGALEALNGMILFGLTTAFLFRIVQREWPLGTRG